MHGVSVLFSSSCSLQISLSNIFSFLSIYKNDFLRNYISYPLSIFENKTTILLLTMKSGCLILINLVTVQYLHSYESKSIENRLRRWDFDLHVSGFWHFHAKTPRGTVGSE